MRNVRFSDDVVKEFRRLVRNSNLGNAFKAALAKVYSTGYENGQKDAYDDARQKLQQAANHADQSAGTSDHVDGERV